MFATGTRWRLLVPLLALSLAAVPADEDPRRLLEQASAELLAGNFNRSASLFDRLAALVPSHAPHLWQRGIALYYAGRYRECREQFESHRRVNPADVENAAWHYLCVARQVSPAEARKALLPVGEDPRIPMKEIYGMFQGDVTPAQVIQAAGPESVSQFYAHLYAGLYAEALGRNSDAARELRQAAEPRYRDGGYMHRIAQAHARRLSPARDVDQVWEFDNLRRIGEWDVQVEGNPKVIDTPLGRAIQFDGDGDALFFENHPLAGARAFTWEVIFRPESGGRKEQRFFHLQSTGGEGGAPGRSRLLFETRLDGGEWYLDSFAQSGPAAKALIDPRRKHPLDRWYHAALVYDGRELRNFVDGRLEGMAEISLEPQSEGRTSAGVRINRVDYFRGSILRARFTRRALTPGEFLKIDAAR